MNIFEGVVAVLLASVFCVSLSKDVVPGVVIVIISQENSYHRALAENLSNDILNQGKVLKLQPIIHILPNKRSHLGYWTVIPEFPRLLGDYGSNSSWIFFCDDSTVVNLEKLLEGLSYQKTSKSEKVWLGYGLSDEEPSIIHHFAFAENPSVFKYPLFSAGFAITTALIKDTLSNKSHENQKDSEFSIDASHELALYIGTDNPLIHEPTLFCDKPGPMCASYPAKIKLCSPPVEVDEIFFAVKTCHKFHQDRVPFVQKTWGQYAKHIKFFSDVGNKTIPTTPVGVKNTERGHCEKTLKVLQLSFNEIIKNDLPTKWIVLADDDTILSVQRLQSLLACYNWDTVVGERYGYKVRHGRGYNYLTGGGGIAFGIKTILDILERCNCPQIDSPDDMIIGMCMTSLRIPFTHSPLFHQARPMDYARSYLNIGLPISFHKHWNLDPFHIYNKWFSSASTEPRHTEL